MISEMCMPLLILTVSIGPTPSNGWEYCKPRIQEKLCPGTNHTVCDPSNAFEQVMFVSEKFLGHVPITRKLKRVLLHIHNDYRNRVASGKEIRNAGEIKLTYPIASRMRELVWDNELMYVAHQHTRQVTMAHDKCRNTQRYLNSGQNLGWQGNTNYIPIISMLTRSLEEMYLEKDAVPDPMAMAAEYSRNLKPFHVGHFTAMMNDRVSRMGCAIAVGANCTDNSDKVHTWCYYLACNYDSTNLVNQYVYKTDAKAPGAKCSDWNVGKSSRYFHLCGNSGKYFDPTEEVGDKLL